MGRDLVGELPLVFTVGFVWPTDSPKTEDIRELLNLIDNRISLRFVFCNRFVTFF
jgi:hypothetical protein